MISKIFTVRNSERGMSSHHQPSFCNLKVRKNGLQLGRQRQQSVCERCIRIAGVSYRQMPYAALPEKQTKQLEFMRRYGGNLYSTQKKIPVILVEKNKGGKEK